MSPASRRAATALPAALQPWHRWLQWFEPALAVQLGDLLLRLDPLLGRLQDRVQAGPAPPDGLGDLQPRGPYERLLATEWLLAGELPDEFLRRAAMGEHLFLAPPPQGRKAQRLIVALFDAGPLQLGAPRLAHLALWILLARRALAGRGLLRWGVLQAPGELRPAETAGQLRWLLTDRSFEPASARHEGGWRQALAALPAPPAECWLVGAGSLATSLQPTHHVSMRRHLAGDALEVAVAQPRRPERALRLPLPPAAAASALLRGEFGAAARPPPHERFPQPLSLLRAPVLSLKGRLVAVPLLDLPGVVVFTVPPGRHRRPTAPRYQGWQAGVEPLALCFDGKQVTGVLGDREHLFFWQQHGLSGRPRPPDEAFHAPPGAAAWLPAAWLRRGSAERLCVLDRAGRLLRWDLAGPGVHGPLPEPPAWLDTHVLALAQCADDSVVYARMGTAGMARLCCLHAEGPPVVMTTLSDARPDSQVWLALGGPDHRSGGACAVGTDRGSSSQQTWRVTLWPPEDEAPAAGAEITARDAYSVTLLPGWKAVGLVRDGRTDHYTLVVLSDDRRQLYRVAARRLELLFTATAPVLKCSVCPNSGLVALLTEQRQLVVYATSEQAVRLIVDTGPAQQPQAHGIP
jgi:hypothetical protein